MNILTMKTHTTTKTMNGYLDGDDHLDTREYLEVGARLTLELMARDPIDENDSFGG